MSDCDDSKKFGKSGQVLDIPGIGSCMLPHEFAIFTGAPGVVERHKARESPRSLHARLAAGATIILSGSYAYVDAVFRYCQRFEHGLVMRQEVAGVTDQAQRSAAFTAMRRRKLHRLLLTAQGDRLLDVQDPPDTAGLQEWLLEPTGGQIFLIPVRRLQRILTDMRRAREGLAVPVLGGTIAISPHVYIPADTSVPAMFAEYGQLMEGKLVLDMGTGTGVLALLAARLGAHRVVATDSNPKAVANARLNAKRLGVEGIVEVRGPADLFAAVSGSKFDVILFNAPWIHGEPQTLYDTANYDPGYRVMDGFIQAALRHLAPGGVILLQYSDISQRKGDNSLDQFHAAVAANGLRIAGSRDKVRASRRLGSRERVFLFEIRRAGERNM